MSSNCDGERGKGKGKAEGRFPGTLSALSSSDCRLFSNLVAIPEGERERRRKRLTKRVRTQLDSPST